MPTSWTLELGGEHAPGERRIRGQGRSFNQGRCAGGMMTWSRRGRIRALGLRRPRRRARAYVAITGVVLALATHGPLAVQAGISGRAEVRQVEAGFRLGSDLLRLRVHLVTGQAVEYETRDLAEVERILDLVHVFSAQRTRLFAELDGNTLRAVHVSVP
jgi:hypothetical protein